MFIIVCLYSVYSIGSDRMEIPVIIMQEIL